MEQQLLEEQKKPNGLAFKVALIIAIYMLLLMIVMRMLGINVQLEETPTTTKVIGGILNWLPFIYAIFYVQQQHRKELEGYISFGRAFSAGFKTAAYSGLFIGIFMIVYYQFVDPAAMNEIVDASIENAENSQQAEGINKMRPYFALMSGFGTAVMFTISGLIISLISAAILKKERPLR